MKLINLIKKTSHSEIELSEKALSNILFDFWTIIFPDLKLIEREFHLIGDVRSKDTGGRIDFFAYNSLTQKFVIIEIKNKYDKNIRSQIYDYADYIEDNFEFTKLRAKEIIPDIQVQKNTFELILIAKVFKSTDYSRINKYEYPTKLITYRYFKNSYLTLDIFENSFESKKEKIDIINEPINIFEQNEDLKGFWKTFNDLVIDNTLVVDKDYMIKGPDLIIRIDRIYDKYFKRHINNDLSCLSIHDLRTLLKSSPTYKKGKSVRFDKQVTMGYIFDYIETRKKYIK